MARLGLLLSLLTVAISACTQSTNSSQVSKPLTPEQVAAVHGKLFRAGTPGQIQQQLAATKGDVVLRPFGMSSEIGFELPLGAKLLTLTCQSDLAIVAKAGPSLSHPTADQGFVYTDWQFTVEEVLKDNPKAPIPGSATIVVTRPGGVLEINGRKVQAKLAHFRDFVQGEELLLYLQYVPETGAYSISQPNYFGISDEVLKGARDAANASVKDCGGRSSEPSTVQILALPTENRLCGLGTAVFGIAAEQDSGKESRNPGARSVASHYWRNIPSGCRSFRCSVSCKKTCWAGMGPRRGELRAKSQERGPLIRMGPRLTHTAKGPVQILPKSQIESAS